MKKIIYSYPKSSFLSTEKDMSIIVNTMLKNERLKKLLHYTTKDCLSQPSLTEDESLALFGKNIKIVTYPIIIFPWGYCALGCLTSLCFLNNAIDIVIGPNLPIIIKQAIINLPSDVNFAVIPNVNPTVPKAEITSKNISIKLNVLNSAICEIYISSCIDASETNNPRTPAIIIKTLIANITIALLNTSIDIFFLNILISFFPCIKLIIHNINIATSSGGVTYPTYYEEGVELGTDASLTAYADIAVSRVVRDQEKLSQGETVENTTLTVNSNHFEVRGNVDVDNLNMNGGVFEFLNELGTNAVNVTNDIHLKPYSALAGSGVLNIKTGTLTIDENSRLAVSNKSVKFAEN